MSRPAKTKLALICQGNVRYSTPQIYSCFGAGFRNRQINSARKGKVCKKHSNFTCNFLLAGIEPCSLSPQRLQLDNV